MKFIEVEHAATKERKVVPYPFKATKGSFWRPVNNIAFAKPFPEGNVPKKAEVLEDNYCSECDKSFKTEPALKAHNTRYHSE